MDCVALYTSAWIEIYSRHAWPLMTIVALYTSAWIEIFIRSSENFTTAVALYTSAWIERFQAVAPEHYPQRRTLHECVDWNSKRAWGAYRHECRTLHECVDWNYKLADFFISAIMSHSTRVRGLKSPASEFSMAEKMSHSTRVRGLK